MMLSEFATKSESIFRGKLERSQFIPGLNTSKNLQQPKDFTKSKKLTLSQSSMTTQTKLLT